jgi:uncharacterized protein GlcG (DUF336 family)
LRILSIAALLVTSAAHAQTPAAPPQKLVSPAFITLDQAMRISKNVIAACAKRKEAAAVTITDADGFTRVSLSADNLPVVGLRTAALKTATVLEFRQATRALGEKLEKDPAFRDGPGKDPRFFFHPGALPLYRAGQFVGVLAVGGGHDKDEACAFDALASEPDLKVTP